MIAVLWVQPQDVGEALLGLAAGAIVCLVLALVLRDDWGDPSPTMLRLAGMAALGFVTLGVTSMG
jgi:hypothetical protein